MATIDRPRDAVCPEPAGDARSATAAEITADPESSIDEPEYYFWGINELYVAP